MIKDQLNEEQLEAFTRIVQLFTKEEVTPVILSGGAGTGKSLTVNAALQDLRHLNIAKVAFTGRAASHIDGMTCHSLLYKPVIDSNGDLIRFDRKNEEEVLQSCSSGIIVDESSMLPKSMFDEILAVGVPVLFVGDLAQLPPIDKNNPGFNAMEEDFDTIVLTTIMRTHDDSYGIQEISNHLREKNSIPRKKFSGGVSFVPRGKVMTKQFHEENRYTAVMCGMNKTRKKLNELIRAARGYTSETPEEGEIVICLKNSVREDVKINNGEMYRVDGVIPMGMGLSRYLMTSVDDPSKKVSTIVEDTTWTSEFTKRKEYDTFGFGYAMTVHKCQGSTLESALYIDEDVSFFLDQQKFRYTAVTRASHQLTIAI